MDEKLIEECDKIKTEDVYGHQRRIIALGDIHGDLEALLSCLADVAQVIKYEYDEKTNILKYKWIGGDTFVVIVGDIMDRKRDGQYFKSIKDEDGYLVGEIDGEEDIIINLINRLSVKASKSGGKVIKLLGNHEIMNLYGDYSYVSDKTLQRNGGKEERKKMFGENGKLSDMVIKCGTKAIVKIGDWIFVHGGILPGIIKALKTNDNFISEANRLARHMFSRSLNENDRKLAKMYFITNDLKEKTKDEVDNLYNRRNSILNERRLAIDTYGGITVPIKTMCQALQNAFDLLGYDKIKTNLVVAHSIQLERGLIRRTDTEPGYISGYVYKKVIEQDNKRTIYAGIGQKYKVSLKDDFMPHGLNFECPYGSKKTGQIWRIDVGMSRGFDGEYLKNIPKKLLNKILNARKPSVLEILYDNNTQEYETRVLIANKHLHRKWYNN
jgi:hypothetical protein